MRYKQFSVICPIDDRLYRKIRNVFDLDALYNAMLTLENREIRELINNIDIRQQQRDNIWEKYIETKLWKELGN